MPWSARLTPCCSLAHYFGARQSLDARNIPALGRIGEPDDIIGTVLVEEGKVRQSLHLWTFAQFDGFEPRSFPPHINECPHIGMFPLLHRLINRPDAHSNVHFTRVCTTDGVTQLPEGLSGTLLEELNLVHRTEKQQTR